MNHAFRSVLVTLPAFGILFAPAIANSGPLDRWQAEKVPRLRIASSPYPNFLLHILPTGADFGDQLYRVRISSLGMGPSSETSRGHFYTEHGGFLDLAHIRRTIDFVAYLHYHLTVSLNKRKTHFSFSNIDKTTYHSVIIYPDFWDELTDTQQKRIIKEIALETAAQAAFDFSNWREILTWYDFHNVPGMPETGSAFSYEDIPSHAVGTAVAVRAIDATGMTFNDAVTRELKRELETLRVVPYEDYLKRMDSVKDKWWGHKTCLKRFIDTGRDDGRITPWLVRGSESEGSFSPKSYPAPRRDFSNIYGHDCSGMIVFECEPHMPKKNRVLTLPGPDLTRIRTDRDYPVILDHVHEEILREFGPHATVPYP